MTDAPPPVPEQPVHRHPAGPRPRLLTSVLRGLPGTVVLLLGGLAWWWLATHHFTGGGDHAAPAEGSDTAATGPAIVRIPDSAARDAIGLATIASRPLRPRLTVPGRLDYDARSRIDYASPVAGIVSRLCVEPRQRVDRGDSLAEISSPEVGLARDEVAKRQAEREIARRAAEWGSTIADNVQSMLAALASHPRLDEVERGFEGRTLGDYREKILGAYSKLLLVEKVDAGTRQLGEGGVLSGRIVEERTSNLEVARASFVAACESARFDTAQERAKATADLEQAERLLQVARENLRTLVGSRLDDSAADPGASTPADEAAPGGSSLSEIALRTPLAGVVEEIFVSRGERVASGERMFVVADTSRLWVRAQVHEKQWTTADVAVGQEIRVAVPGAEEHRTRATINHVAATVDPASRSVPIVADLTNDDAHYKPGMFVWVELPQGEARDVLAVPVAAVMRHEGRAFVFVPEADGFRRVDIDTGIESDDFVEVTRGLKAGQQVVDRGAFLLKSELLLEDEG
ncbi:MAG: efflux RND transporter periplasmic adaptor subunit [Planctomycetaceae bacterium]